MNLPTLQDSVERYSRSLEVSQRLIALHPHEAGGSGNHAALAPAVTLSVTAAFEGFVEEFLAAVLLAQGHGFAQVAKKVTMNNPTPRVFAVKMSAELPGIKTHLAAGFSLQVWNIPAVNGHLATETIDWNEAVAVPHASSPTGRTGNSARRSTGMGGPSTYSRN